MIPALFAQTAGGYSIVHLAVIAVGVLAVIALVALYVRVSGVKVPDWIVQAFWIVLAAIVIIIAIHIVASMMW